MTKHHNGYTNYATWCFASWIDNSESLYNKFHKLIQRKANMKVPPTRDAVRIVLHDELQRLAADLAPSQNNTFWDSIYNDILKEQINYREIAEEMLETEGYSTY
jgi:hypothetical protein